ncbi:hypothetical protein OG302_03310 [Streptomyces sp. NBC_01283]|uniref:hypothetical protein n=1 Tax=Streptomyces sp. NBC_01283 TaxID=2903812 RepID=UPI00352DD588|nr:hypothetical protein OG302_03310 [Streptomyces sp. NBC_01283]
MAWSVVVRRPKVLVASGLWALVSKPWAGSVRVARPEAPPVLMRRVDGCLVIEVRDSIGPAAEARLGRVLHAAIRAGGTGVLVDLRRARDLGVSGFSVLQLARTLAEQRGLTFDVAAEEQSTPELPRSSAS